jgi:hypothetical protein
VTIDTASNVTFASLRAGAKNFEATVHRSSGRWVASEVERSGGDDLDDD